MFLKQLVMQAQIKHNYSLRQHHFMRTHAQADYFIRVDNMVDLVAALKYARRKKLAVYLLGAGSNTLLCGTIHGIVIQIALCGYQVTHSNGRWVWVTVQAGENWHQWVDLCLAHGWYGLENMAGIPGSIGAAPIQNIGAYGSELSDFCTSVQAIQLSNGHVVNIKASECEFSYRNSIFKSSHRHQYIITAISLRLHRLPHPQYHYPALRKALLHRPRHPRIIRNTVLRIRRSKLPHPQLEPNLGSFFHNPIISTVQYKQLRSRYPNIVAWPQADHFVKISAAWLLDQDGWKGYSHNGIQINARQPLVLINHYAEHSSAILHCAEQIRRSILERFNIHLSIEPACYGDA